MTDTKNRSESEKDELESERGSAPVVSGWREKQPICLLSTPWRMRTMWRPSVQALGFDRITFYGASYGTELGQYLMRQSTANLRAVVLDAVVPTQFNLVTQVSSVKQRIAQKYFQELRTRGCLQGSLP